MILFIMLFSYTCTVYQYDKLCSYTYAASKAASLTSTYVTYNTGAYANLIHYVIKSHKK